MNTHALTLMPKGLMSEGATGYTSDWKEVSAKTRAAASYICSVCHVDLSSHHHLCDVHHLNGVKSDNRSENLQVVCKDCHRKQPFHEGVFISSEAMAKIQNLRSLQGIFATSSSWQEVLDLTDTAIHGDLLTMQKVGYLPPIPGLDIQNAEHEVIATLEAAWPHQRMGISLPDYHRDSASFNRRCGIGAVRQPILTSSIIIDSRLNR